MSNKKLLALYFISNLIDYALQTAYNSKKKLSSLNNQH